MRFVDRLVVLIRGKTAALLGSRSVASTPTATSPRKRSSASSSPVRRPVVLVDQAGEAGDDTAGLRRSVHSRRELAIGSAERNATDERGKKNRVVVRRSIRAIAARFVKGLLESSVTWKW